MKVCLDTNVLVSGIFWRGIPGKIMDLWANNRFSIAVSIPILQEYQRVLHQISQKIDPSLGDLWMKTITQRALLVKVAGGTSKYSRDRDDDKFVECALCAGADHLVTGDEDLLTISADLPFHIVSPRIFLQEISGR